MNWYSPSGGTMRRTLTIIATASLVAGLSLVGAVTPAAAEPDTRFGSCRAMWAVDPNGVARTERAAARAAKQGFRTPLLCPTAYAANSRFDTDRDGVACERKR
jgi:hypothetical protein